MPKSYKFSFIHEGCRGVVDVFPAGANVYWGGMGFQIEAAGSALSLSILKARIALAELFR